MTVQGRSDFSNIPFIRTDNALSKEVTFAQDEARVDDLEAKTLVSYDPTAEKWVPFTDETASDGTQFPKGIIAVTIPAASLAAGDVENVPVYVGNMVIDRDQLVIENGKTLGTIVNVPAGLNQSVEDLLKWIGIFCENTTDIDGYEN